MSQYLLTGNFQIFENNSVTQSFFDKVLSTHDCSNFGYVLIVDLIYSDDIKEKSKNFSFCPVNEVNNPDKFKSYMKEVDPKQYRPNSKMVCDQTNKEYYIIQYRNLKLYVRMGMINIRVHGIVSFDQSPWLKKYIDNKTKKRAQADSVFKKEYHKSLSNSSRGKTMQDVRNRIGKEFVRNRDKEENFEILITIRFRRDT